MPGDQEEIAKVVTMTGPSPSFITDSSKDKSETVVTTTPDDIARVRGIRAGGTERETQTPSRSAFEELSYDTMNSSIRGSRRSTATGSFEASKRRVLSRWPTVKELGPGIYWYTPAMMIFLLLAGLFGALGHHMYNARLDGQPVIDAQWPQRWGVAMAFFVKMTLVGAVQTAVKQRAWLAVKKRGFRVKTLNSIFHACYDPLEFFNGELFIGAFFPALLALLVWVLPLSAIASPSTLTATTGLRNFSAMCTNVSTLNFNLENGFGLDSDPDANKEGMSYWDIFDNGTYYFDSPSMDSQRNFQLSMLSSQPLQPDSPCPMDSNCTFSTSFTAPSYKCELRDDFGGMRAYNLSQMAPYGSFIYASYSSSEEDPKGRPLDWNLTAPNDNTGIFRSEPSLWVAWVYNTTVPATPENATQWNTSYWKHQLRTHVAECTIWNSTYSYDLAYLQGKMNVSSYSVRQDSLMLPPGIIMAPYMSNYMEWAGFHATGWLYRTMLAGNLTMNGQDSYVITKSNIAQTNIINPGTGLAYEDNLGPTIESSFHNVYLSFLSDSVQQSQVFVDMPCKASAHILVWSYRATWLALPYFIAVAATFAAVGVGLHAIATNGYVAQTNFSTFLSTTRSPGLDKLAEGSCLGAWPLTKELRNTSLRFGQTAAAADMQDEVGGDRPAHAAFGFIDRVTPIVKGRKYS